MAFRKYRGRTAVKTFIKGASTAILRGQMVKSDTGRVIRADSSTNEALIGVALDSYALDSSLEPVRVIVPMDLWTEWEIDVDSDGGLVASDVLTFRDLGSDTNGAGNTVDRSLTANKVIFITKRISATKCLGVIASSVVNTASLASIGGAVST